MNTISCQELKEKLAQDNPSFKLVNALEPFRFELKHIPQSLNFTTPAAVKNALSLDDEIVVYCTNFFCRNSIILYQHLAAMGYQNIARFAGGVEEWEKRGYPLEGTMARPMNRI